MISEFAVERIEKAMEFWCSERQRHLDAAMVSADESARKAATIQFERCAVKAFCEIQIILANDKARH